VSARDRLALAADVPLPAALALYPRISPWVGTVKVGLSLFVEHGPAAVRAFREAGAQVFLDLKLHDIPNTVELAAARAGALGVSLLTVHASGGAAMVSAAVAGARRGGKEAGLPPPKILAVTVLTSLGLPELQQLGWGSAPSEVVSRLARLAKDAGADGAVCSPREAGALRQAHGPGFFLCTPGIRAAEESGGDQARTETAAFANAAGADLLVVGRPIHGAADPVTAARALSEQIR
jgi:orotidine-5'-phosphate decarboxylase